MAVGLPGIYIVQCPGFGLDRILTVEFEFTVSSRLRLRLECG